MDGDQIIVDLEKNEVNCSELNDDATFSSRKEIWNQIVQKNGGVHPSIGDADTRLLFRMRNSAVPAIFGAGMHPGRVVWVSEPREPDVTSFQPNNKYRT